jgi:hypothetical protein
MSRGIVYSASIDDCYVEEAFLSAESVKRRYPFLPITLFTDRPQHPLCRTECFDSVLEIDGVNGLRPWSAGQLNRLRCLTRTPYDLTLHLDTDTRIVTDGLLELFGILENADLAMAETAVDDSYSRITFGRRMFNAGLALFRRHDVTLEWLKRWGDLSERNFIAAVQTPLPSLPILDHVNDELIRRKLLGMDQISLVEILGPESNHTMLRIKVLDYSWNHRGSRLPQNNRVPPKILHLPMLKKTIAPDLLSVVERWKKEKRLEEAASLYHYAETKQAKAMAPSEVKLA